MTLTTLQSFDEFYNRLCEIEESANSWVDEDYENEMVERKMQRRKREQYKSNLKSKKFLKYREIDLRRMLLHRIGKYELEEGEIFE